MNGTALAETLGAAMLSLAGVAIAATAVKLFGRETPIAVTPEIARAELELAFPTFRPAVYLGDHPARQTALLLDAESRRLAVVFGVGTQLTSRSLPADQARLTVQNRRVTLHLADLTTPEITLRLPPDVPDQFRQLLAQQRAHR